MTAKDYAVKLLAFCDRSEKEIRDKIMKKGYSEEECEEAVAFCRTYGYIDDNRYAQHFVHDAVNLKKIGKAKIKAELAFKGVDRELIDCVTEEIGNEEIAIKSEMEKRFANLDFSDKKVKNKVFGYFARRGYKTKDILRAMNEEYDGYDE